MIAIVLAMCRASWRLDDAATAVALAPDGAYLAHGDASGVLCLRRASDGALLQCVAAHDARVSGLAFDSDSDGDGHGATLVSAGADGKVIVWDVPSLRVRARHDAGAPIVHLAARAGRVAAATAHAVEIWRPTDDQIERRTPSAVTAMTFLPDGQLRTSVDPSVHALAAAPDGRTLYVAAWTGSDLAGASLTAIPLP
jgi:WD40 repeat protein